MSDKSRAENHRDLIAWPHAGDWVEVVPGLAKQFPQEKQYRPTSQVRGAFVSVPSSTTEVGTQLLIALRPGYFKEDDIDHTNKLSKETGRIISGLKRNLQKSGHEGSDCLMPELDQI